MTASTARHRFAHPDGRVAAIAARQDTIITYEQLLDAGVRRGAIAHRVRTGRLVRLHRGIYSVVAPPHPPQVALRAALLAARDAALGYRTGAAWWLLVPSLPAVVDVVVRGRSPRMRDGVCVHRSKHLTADDVTTHRGLPVTTPVRTLIDFAAVAPEAEVARAAAEAQVLRLATATELRAATGARPGLPGAAALRRMLDAPDAAPSRSALERRLVRLVRDSGLPPPEVNARVGGVEVDALWRAQRVVVETDGWAAHGHRAAFERDRARDAELAAGGYVVLRFTWRQVRDEPLLVATRVAQTLARRESSTATSGPAPVHA